MKRSQIVPAKAVEITKETDQPLTVKRASFAFTSLHVGAVFVLLTAIESGILLPQISSRGIAT